MLFLADNGSSHPGQASIDRITRAWPTGSLVSPPVHASWLDQAEIDLSVVQREMLTPSDHDDLDEVEAALIGCERRDETATGPCERTRTRSDLSLFLTRLEAEPDPDVAARPLA